jgi:crotonobetainyl-CoA:carnitine CoA-transferase CaiB-like acyl-CoA transferase
MSYHYDPTRVILPETLHHIDFASAGGSALDDVRVVDLSRLVAGNQTSVLLADHGAEVIKVEKPGRGDDLRDWQVEGISTYWKVYGRNKKSVALDIRHEADLMVVKALIATAHVLIENFVPGTLEQLGLDEKELFRLNSRLVILRISGWGQTGPFRHKPGFGTMVEAMSGFAAMNGFADKPPALPPLALADMIAGAFGAFAVTMAVRHAERTGVGQTIDLSLFEPILSVLGPDAANYVLTGAPASRRGNRASNAAPRNVYACCDGRFVALSASMQSTTERLFRLMGRADLIDDPRFRTNTDRLRNIEELDALIGAFMAARTRAEVLDLCDQARVTVAPLYDASDLVGDPYVIERECLITVEDAEMGRLPMHNVSPRLGKTPGAIRRPAPRVGQHNAEIFDELGLDSATRARLGRKDRS